MTTSDDSCLVCGLGALVHNDVLWPELVEAWELQPEERAYIDVQQGTHCDRCGGNVRSQALARAFTAELGWEGSLAAYLTSGAAPTSRVLEINEAGSLTPWLSQFPGHTLAKFPDCDMTQMKYATASFDYVVHSDTLEHVPDPAAALRECARVLVPGGACVFTVPIILGRLTRSRIGLPPSYHGHPTCRDADFMVHTEFGANVWTDVLAAGFRSCQFVTFRYPAGLALVARR